MRELLFRGQQRKKGEKVRLDGSPVESSWFYGSGVFQSQGDFSIIYQSEPEFSKHSVYSDTVGQYTGLTDKHGEKIFEGDIIEINHPFEGSFISSVIWYKDCWTLKDFYFACFDYPGMAFSEGTEYMKVIGNIYDNPELLEGGGDKNAR